MLVSTKALVFSALKYGEADLIVRAYTLSDGLKTYMLKGILKSKKGKFRTSMFQALTPLEIVANHRNKGTMEYLKDARVLYNYRELHTQIVKSALLMFLVEVLHNTIQEEEANPALFNFLEENFKKLDKAEKIGNFHLWFLLQLTAYLGFYPEKSKKELPFFNLLEGNFELQETGSHSINGENIRILKVFLGINFDEIGSVKLNQSNRKKFLNMLMLYYELHIEGFKKPRSLSVFNEIFS